MKLFDLLDKPEQRQVKIIQLILRNNQQIPLTSLIDELHIDRTTLKEDLEMINDHLKEISESIYVIQEKGIITFVRDIKTSANEIYFTYLQKATKYRLLILLMKDNKLSQIAISNKLSVSSSTLERRIRELNNYLIDFHISIKNGKITGQEIQIRHFYLQLLWFANPYKLNQNIFGTLKMERIVKSLNPTTDLPLILNEAGIVKLEIYLSIVKKRIKNIPAQSLLDNLQFNSELYQIISNKVRHIKDLSEIIQTPYESKLLFLFLISNFCLDIENELIQNSLEEELANFDLVNKIHTKITESVNNSLKSYHLDLDFVKKINLSLIQVHFRAVYMRGWLAIFGDQGIYDQLAFLPEGRFFDVSRGLCTTIINMLALTGNDKRVLLSEISGRYASIFHLAFRSINFRLKIGCDFGYEDIMAQIIIDNITQKIDSRIDVEISVYSPKKQYDIIIGNLSKDYPEQEKFKLFVMLGTEYDTDFPMLNSFLEKEYFSRIKYLGAL